MVELKAQGLGLIIDIVPNHYGQLAGKRPWRDVLEYGKESRYARHFDIDWSRRTDAAPFRATRLTPCWKTEKLRSLPIPLRVNLRSPIAITIIRFCAGDVAGARGRNTGAYR